jgi:hypothetical protein
MNYYERLYSQREAYFEPRRQLADRLLARWQRDRASKRYDVADRVLKRAKQIGIDFYFSKTGPFWGFSTLAVRRFARRWQRFSSSS